MAEKIIHLEEQAQRMLHVIQQEREEQQIVLKNAQKELQQVRTNRLRWIRGTLLGVWDQLFTIATKDK